MAGVEECYGALQSKDLIRLRAMWHPDAGPDEERLRRLSRILRDSSANVGERIDHAPAIGLESASFEFGVPLAWRESSERAKRRAGLPRGVRPHRGPLGTVDLPDHIALLGSEPPVIGCRTLGPIEVTVDGEPAPPELLWRKHLALLVYLARSPRQTRSRDHLIALLWADRTEAAARHSLSEALRVLRRHGGAAAVEVTVGQVGLGEGAVDLDVDRLEQLAAAESWPAAAELVAGEFLEGFGVPDATAFEDWLAAEREHWRRRSVEVLIRSADGLARAARAADAADIAARALAIEPDLRGCLLRGDPLHGAGRRPRGRPGAGRPVPCPPGRARRRAGTGDPRDGGARASRARRAPRVPPRRPWTSPPSSAPRSRGRSEELARLLDEATRAARTGRSMLLLIEGEAGVGKSRLLDEMLALLRLDGTPVGLGARGRGRPVGSLERGARARARRPGRDTRRRRPRRRRRSRRSPTRFPSGPTGFPARAAKSPCRSDGP